MSAPEIVVIGCSWGGLKALRRILSGLPEDFPAAIAVAQHRDARSSEGLPAAIQSATSLEIRDVIDKEPIVAGRVYLAPPDYHLLVEPGSFALSTEGAVMFARPSVDVLFESAAVSYGEAVVAVVLTGANEDGAAGARAVKDHGGSVVVQDPRTAERGEMPRAALATTDPDAVLALDDIAAFLTNVCTVSTGGN
ncbi:MAG TPA: chemotaxis protein CheB [Actinomycetota bacterium]|nr:chemotaxis protein CheB [Actinomycetota bacterium]